MAGFTLVPGSSGHNYTGMLTRSIVFSGALVFFLAATAMTIAAIIVPNWISFDNTTNQGTQLHYTYGLHRRCSNTSPSSPLVAQGLNCVQFPRDSDCHGDNRYFCSMWRSVGFLMSFAVMMEGMTIAAFAILLAGGKQRREQGWGVMAILAALAALIQVAAMGIMVRKKLQIVVRSLLTFHFPGLPLRIRRSFLCRLVSRQELGYVHGVVELPSACCCGYHYGCADTA